MKKIYALLGLVILLTTTISGNAQVYRATHSGAWTAGSTWDINGVPSNPCNACTITIAANIAVTLNTSTRFSGGTSLNIGEDATSPAALLIPNSGGTSFATGFNILMDVSNPTNLIRLRNANTSVIAIAAGTYDGVFADFANGFLAVKLIGNAPTNFIDGAPAPPPPPNGAPERSFLGGPATLNAQDVLPILLSDFTATLNNNVVNLAWTTAEEINSDHFGVLHSTDASHWQSLGIVAAKGFSSSSVNYTFTDASPSSGVNYYKLQMVDKDGKFKYSKVVAVQGSLTKGFGVFPNPANSFVNISVGNDITSEMSIRMISQYGQTMMQRKLAKAGGTTVTIPVSSYPQGLYMLQLVGSDGSKQTFRVMITH